MQIRIGNKQYFTHGNSTMNETDQRLENLEIKLMDLENVLAELNHVIIRQSGEIDLLKQSQQRLLNQIDSLEHPRSGTSDEPPPPHY